MFNIGDLPGNLKAGSDKHPTISSNHLWGRLVLRICTLCRKLGYTFTSHARFYCDQRPAPTWHYLCLALSFHKIEKSNLQSLLPTNDKLPRARYLVSQIWAISAHATALGINPFLGPTRSTVHSTEKLCALTKSSPNATSPAMGATENPRNLEVPTRTEVGTLLKRNHLLTGGRSRRTLNEVGGLRSGSEMGENSIHRGLEISAQPMELIREYGIAAGTGLVRVPSNSESFQDMSSGVATERQSLKLRRSFRFSTKRADSIQHVFLDLKSFHAQDDSLQHPSGRA